MKTHVRRLKKMHSGMSHSGMTPGRFHLNAVKATKRIFYLFIFIGVAAVFNSCEAGWVASEPSYRIEIERPARPGNGYVWIEGGWRWDHSRQQYDREPGYWARERPNHSYANGYWKSGRRGKSWVKGHWERGHGRDDGGRWERCETRQPGKDICTWFDSFQPYLYLQTLVENWQIRDYNPITLFTISLF